MTTTASVPPKSDWKAGDRVRHYMWGEGRVISSTSDRAMVSFDDGEVKTVKASFLAAGKTIGTGGFVAANDNRPAGLPKNGDTPPGTDTEPSEPLTFVDPTEWHGKPVPTRQWYAPDLVPLRQVTIVNGDGGVGKSLLTLQLAAAGAMEVDTLDMAPLPGRTLYVGAEDEADEFWRRLLDIAKMHRRTLEDLSSFRLLPLADRDALLSVPNKAGNMLPTPLMQTIVEYAAEWKPRLIVFDTAADLFGGDEIKRGQVRQFIGQLRKLAIGLDCAVVLLAHPSVQGIQSGSGSSGSTAWNNSVRSRLYLTRPDDKGADPDLRILKTMKANYGTTGGEIKIRWKDGAFVLDDGRPPVGMAMVAAHAERVFKEVLSNLNRSGMRVSTGKGVNYAPTVMADMPGAEGVSKKALEAAMKSLLSRGEIKVIMEGPQSKQRQKLIVSAEDFSVPMKPPN